MSKADSIQKKIWKAYGKVANTFGKHSYEVYRSELLTDPITDNNVIDSALVAFSKDDKFKKAEDSNVSMWICWIDGNLENLFDIQAGDFLYSEEAGETYYIVSAGSHVNIQAIKTNATVSIQRSGYSDGGNGFAPGDNEVAVAVPCYIRAQSSTTGTLGYIPASSYATDGVANYEVYIWDPSEEISIKDVIIDHLGNRSQVLTVTHSDIGTKLVTRVYEP